LFMAATYVFARRAEHAKKLQINSAADVRRRSRSIVQRKNRIFAARLLVVTVANAVWQQAVSSLAHNSAAVIIDVSIPSDNLRWEIDTLLPAMERRCILVGRLDLLTKPGPDGKTVFASALGRAVDGHDVLAYETGPAGTRRFSRALRAALESRADSN
jgi:hypothetical protein